MLQRTVTAYYFRNISLDPVVFRRIQIEGAEAILEIEAVDDSAFAVGECICLHNLHAPGRERAGKGGEQEWLVPSDNRELVQVAMRS